MCLTKPNELRILVVCAPLGCRTALPPLKHAKPDPPTFANQQAITQSLKTLVDRPAANQNLLHSPVGYRRVVHGTSEKTVALSKEDNDRRCRRTDDLSCRHPSRVVSLCYCAYHLRGRDKANLQLGPQVHCLAGENKLKWVSVPQ